MAPSSPTTGKVSSMNPGFLTVEQIRMSFVGGSRAKGKAQAERMSVLDDVSVQVGQGEFCCLIGPSGCGKSTLLRIVAGLIRPDDGTVTIAGVQTVAPRRDVGVVFQSFNLFPWRSVLDNVALGLENRYPRSERKRRAQEWLSVVGLKGFEDFYPSQLSGGMQQRVGICARWPSNQPSC